MTTDMLNFTSLPPLALYIHIPWCVRKCPYCDFNSHEAPGTLPETEYVDALIRDLEQDLPLIWGRPITSIFIGGGTPSLFSAEALDRLFSGLRARLKLLPGIEITLEANPGTVEAGKFREFHALGINRLSIGVQSFQDAQLKALGRIHGGREAIAAAEAAHAAGFTDFNLDLMHGLPGQGVEQGMADVRQAIALQPSHISYYQLTLEPNTLFHARPPRLPDDELLADIEEAGQALLADAGYVQYEVSAYAKEGFRCAHNLNYWEFGDYLGIGAGAHGKITLPAEQRIVRRARIRNPRDFQQHAGTAEAYEETVVKQADVAFEFMLNALRLKDGFTPHLFQERAGMPLGLIRDAMREAESRGLIDWDMRRIKPTPLGWRFLNDLMQCFLPDR
ncbi:MAG: oxygen-independent coproporphyrinogen III oxidase-like protein [Halothiobacillaceae bacterium]|nr:MAG: oxygen-independent coproporphyrinogen III oxidase-like protein [Halothiobacillaceae bacterium]